MNRTDLSSSDWSLQSSQQPPTPSAGPATHSAGLATQSKGLASDSARHACSDHHRSTGVTTESVLPVTICPGCPRYESYPSYTSSSTDVIYPDYPNCPEYTKSETVCIGIVYHIHVQEDEGVCVEPKLHTLGNFQEKEAGLLQKVLNILFIQLLATCCIAAAVTFLDQLKESQFSWIFDTRFALGCLAMVTVSCYICLERTFPLNVALFFIYVPVHGALLGLIMPKYTNGEILLALIITMGIMVTAITFALQSQCDVTFMWLELLVATLLTAVADILRHVLCTTQIVIMIGGCLKALLFSLWLLFDVQTLTAGKRYRILPKDYLLAAANLFVNINAVFFFLLEVIDG